HLVAAISEHLHTHLSHPQPQPQPHSFASAPSGSVSGLRLARLPLTSSTLSVQRTLAALGREAWNAATATALALAATRRCGAVSGATAARSIFTQLRRSSDAEMFARSSQRGRRP